MKNKEMIKLIPTRQEVVVRICLKDYEIRKDMMDSARFELHTMCDIPILTFRFSRPEDVVVAAVNFRSTALWPQTKNLTVIVQLFDLSNDALSFEKKIELSEDDTETINFTRSEQKKMKGRQIDAIIDFIYSDYIDFAGLSEVY